MAKQNKKPSRSYWFKRRRYGWGWTPVTWQGWLSIGLFLALILSATLQLPAKPDQPSTEELTRFLLTVVGAVFGLMLVSLATGPTPRWRWGSKKSDSSDEDY